MKLISLFQHNENCLIVNLVESPGGPLIYETLEEPSNDSEVAEEPTSELKVVVEPSGEPVVLGKPSVEPRGELGPELSPKSDGSHPPRGVPHLRRSSKKSRKRNSP